MVYWELVWSNCLVWVIEMYAAFRKSFYKNEVIRKTFCGTFPLNFDFHARCYIVVDVSIHLDYYWYFHH